MLHVRNQEAPPSAARGTAADPPPAVTDGSAQLTPKPRDPFFDNAKYLAIVLVALGHAWSPMRGDSQTAAALYLFVYAFHMPAFILIAGYFSRGFTGRPDQLRRLITGIGAPYLVFEVLYVLFKRWGDADPDYPLSVLDPFYVTWFLVALFVWRLTAPVWRIVRRPLPVALGIAAVGSVSPHIGSDLNLQRILQLLPYFVLGLQLRREHFELVRRPGARVAAAVLLPVALGLAYWAAPHVDAGWFYRTSSAQEMGAEPWAGVLLSLALFGCGLLLTACFLALVPGRRMWFTALGAGTIYGYLLHGFFIQGSRWWGWYEAPGADSPGGRVVITLIAAVLMTALCTGPVRRVFHYLVEPRMDWAFTHEATRVGQPAGQGRAG
ncbi:acyltransferase family protein [Streptomyces hoynatensis]|uniref:Acyltransferase 3 domain-containing protein n=1 Tax=Streptomyces hoynatensis TaxID=1141874 RepID=A0A3A9YQ83_9ACTN|nr:acyltransferase family protein [Streptomyces hoynatensis]RKN37644.1 hypothetical protein D7294_27305 [Streptomyces hoynatensis]